MYIRPPCGVQQGYGEHKQSPTGSHPLWCSNFIGLPPCASWDRLHSFPDSQGSAVVSTSSASKVGDSTSSRKSSRVSLPGPGCCFGVVGRQGFWHWIPLPGSCAGPGPMAATTLLGLSQQPSCSSARLFLWRGCQGGEKERKLKMQADIGRLAWGGERRKASNSVGLYNGTIFWGKESKNDYCSAHIYFLLLWKRKEARESLWERSWNLYILTFPNYTCW